MVSRTKTGTILFIVFFISCTPLTPVKKLPEDKLSVLLSKSPQSWTYEDCEAIIQNFTAFNMKGYREKIVEREFTREDVFIKATPLNKEVIQARVRKEAIIKRLPLSEFRKRLKEDLESYTNWTMNLENGEITTKPESENELLEEYSFQVYFENISFPHRNIEIFRAEEGFFLENFAGDFSRVVDISSYDIDEYFILVSDLNAIITFSSLTDEGKELFPDLTNLTNFRLVFNGLQAKPIIVQK